MRWTALVPIKQGSGGKSRLSSVLSDDERCQLAARMSRHVLAVLNQCERVAETVILSPADLAVPETRWAQDQGRGLNPEIAAFRESFGAAPLLVIHADLPLLDTGDLDALLSEAERSGAAMATDRAALGTNALALADGRDFTFQFGTDSCTLHLAQDESMPVIQRTGLSADLDTVEDIEFLRGRGVDI